MALTAALNPSHASTAGVRIAHPRCPRTHRGRAANLQRTTRHLPTPRRITWVAASSSSNDDGETVDSTRSFDPHALRVRHFINLKNGIEAVPTLHAMNVHDYAFCRVQSTMCEAGDMEKVLCELDANLLVSLALGYSCVVYDFGSRDKKRGVPRALWYGTEFVRYALDWYWFDAKDDTQTPILRGRRVNDLFRRKLTNLSKSTKKRLKYYRKFVPEDVATTRPGVRLLGAYAGTDNDDDEGYYADVLKHSCAPNVVIDSPDTCVGAGQLDTEAEVVEELTARGFSMFYGGEYDEEWTNRWVHHGEKAVEAEAEA